MCVSTIYDDMYFAEKKRGIAIFFIVITMHLVEHLVVGFSKRYKHQTPFDNKQITYFLKFQEEDIFKMTFPL